MKKRIISAIIAILICTPVVLLGGNVFYIGLALLGIIGFYEIIKVRKKDLPATMKVIGLILFVYLMAESWFNYLSVNTIDIIILIILLTLIPIVFYNKSKKYSVEDAFYLLSSIIFLGVGFNSFGLIRFEGLYLFVYLIMITILTDTFAYFTGYFLGKHKMSPTVSPNKTWEGFIGGSVIGTLVPTVFYMLMFGGNVFVVILVTLLLSLIGQLGDLVFSAIKRHFNIKDYGNIMPGHGGVLDRLDSILFVALAFTYLARFL